MLALDGFHPFCALTLKTRDDLTIMSHGYSSMAQKGAVNLWMGPSWKWRRRVRQMFGLKGTEWHSSSGLFRLLG